ncbi:hypothetical protein [Clostridium estertheticum]|uniref:hypothetical protein n=1 Tax=Clostridium estertheticum TaxID=238834 RepID=UPI001CF5DF3E|nr:hypothetical protein [Clostridium estertheticum]MCB2356906.1 hypothetical protein [Clostridium estertheticum]WAG43994.1 hypothetical protein LL065_25990 [Clostridium estertheticum]
MIKDEMIKVLVEGGKKEIIDIGELILDDFLQDGFLKKLPVVGALFSVIKIGKTIKEYHFSKKILRFIVKFNDGTLDEDKLQIFKEKMLGDCKYANKVTEVIFISIERFDKEIKAEVYARLLGKYIEKIYSWDDFIYYTTVIEQMYINDFSVLQKLICINEKIKIDDLSVKDFNLDKIRGSIERLKSIGFVSITTATNEAVQNYYKSSITLSCIGAKFYENCIYGMDFSIE